MRELTEDGKTVESAVEEAAPVPDWLETDSQSQDALSPDQFRAVLMEIDALGLTWTADLPPQLQAKIQNGNNNFANDKLQQIEDRYPMLPNELGYVIWYALTGTKPLTDLVGTDTYLKDKAEIVRELLITPEFRDEFFFSQMVKVPSFDNLDWEVVVKTCERGVQRFPGNAYALVTILIEGNAHYSDKRETITFAINENRLEKLLAVFQDMREALQRARDVGRQIRECEDSETDASV